MKRHIILSVLLLSGLLVVAGITRFVQGNTPKVTYDTLWKQVDSMEKKNLPKSALEVVNKIFDKARAEKNQPQYIKSLLYKAKYTMRLSDKDDDIKAVMALMEKETAAAEFPARAILQSHLADFYLQYYQDRVYEISQRTPLQDNQGDILTWDIRSFSKRINELYSLSVTDASGLLKHKVRAFKDILIVQERSDLVRPTLYDLLAHRAIRFYSDDASNVFDFANDFKPEDPALFSSTPLFAGMVIPGDAASLKYRAMKLYQQLSRTHARDSAGYITIYLEMERLKFVKQVYSGKNGDAYYERALKDLAARFPGNRDAAVVYYTLAEFYNNDCDSLNRTKMNHIVAENTCEQTISKYPKTEGAKMCRNLLNTIRQPKFHLLSEERVLPGKAFKAQVKYANTPVLYLRFIAMTPLELNNMNSTSYEKRLEKLRSLPPTTSLTVTLPPTANHYEKSVEFIMPALPEGFYVVLTSGDPGFTNKSYESDLFQLHVSTLTLVTLNKGVNGSTTYQVKDAFSGKPVSNVRLEIYETSYDYKTKTYIEKVFRTLETGASGEALYEAALTSQYNYGIRLLKDGKIRGIYPNNYNYRYYSNTGKGIEYKTLFFTDRAIYRPGQTIYYKVLSLQRETGTSRWQIAKNQASTVWLEDVNGKKVTETSHASNDYGSFSGRFVTPVSALTGLFTLRETNGSASVRVEEYKRPKFEVKLEPVKDVITLNSRVNVKGKALAYAGNSLDGARVIYTVSRSTYFPFYSWYRPMPRNGETLVSDTVYTDAEGGFTATFIALPEGNTKPADKPKFTYTINTSVTDINGETHETSTTVNAAWYGIETGIVGIDDLVDINNQPAIKLVCNNVNGQPVPAEGSFTIQKLKLPSDRIYRKSLWTSDTSINNLPGTEKDLPYGDINLMQENAATEKTVYTLALKGAKDTTVRPGIKEWEEGYYKAIFTAKDITGEWVSSTRYFTVFNPASSNPVSPAPFEVISLNTGPVRPGEDAKMLLSTKHDNCLVNYYLEHDGRIAEEGQVNLDRESKVLKLRIKEQYRGIVFVHLQMVRDNRIYIEKVSISVPMSHENPEISLSTFRDRMEPGDSEEWRITLKGKNGEKIAAEMLASMYDASLNQFASLYWPTGEINPLASYPSCSIEGKLGQTVGSYSISYPASPYIEVKYQYFDELNSFNTNYYGRYRHFRHDMEGEDMVLYDSQEVGNASVPLKEKAIMKAPSRNVNTLAAITDKADDMEKNEEDGSGNGENGQGMVAQPAKVRKNFNETAFFFPHLRTNEKGDIIFSFKMPESLTRWRFMAFAHTVNLQTAYLEQEVITTKSLMVQPNIPRFVREGDRITFSAKVVNTDSTGQDVSASLELTDALTGKVLPVTYTKTYSLGSISKGSSKVAEFTFTVPEGIQAITYTVSAGNRRFNDAESNTLPVLPNSILITESQPLPMRGMGSREFNFEKLLQSGQSNTLRQHKVTVEFTSNPAWYAVLSLPYMIEYPYGCSEQVYSRLYASSVAMHIANSDPKIKQVYDAWKNLSNGNALLSNLQKNEDLKALILEETPWVLDGKTENENRKRIAELFDENNLKNSLDIATRKLSDMQLSSGAWPWFSGMREDRYITALIVTGFGRMQKMGIQSPSFGNNIDRARQYLLFELAEEYGRLVKNKVNLKQKNTGVSELQSLYALSYYPEPTMNNRQKTAYQYFKNQAVTYWASFDKMSQGMIALILQRNGDKTTPKAIIRSLSEYAIHHEELGMYWKEFNGGYYWYQAPIESQSIMIEAYDEVSKDTASVDDMRLWLLKQKQTTNWRTTRATADACYALLMKGTNMLGTGKTVDVYLDGQLIQPDEGTQAEAGTGYFRRSYYGDAIKPGMGRIRVDKKANGPAWGAVYWQYFEKLDKVTTATNTALKLEKELYKEVQGAKGKELVKISEGTSLNTGDVVKVRIILTTDRAMEYVHLKDMRAAGFEPKNVLSGYRYQQGLSYYESTRDAATNFFISYMPRGTYVFEYSLVASNKGNMQNGIATMQCMYAPEFTSHSAGVMVTIGEK